MLTNIPKLYMNKLIMSMLILNYLIYALNIIVNENIF